jgi:K+-sensing histidine kinase KdpD
MSANDPQRTLCLNDRLIEKPKDSGARKDSKKLDSIFDAFVTTKPHGMGLGLALCRMIIERHEGHFQPCQLIRAAQFFGLSCLLQGLASHDDLRPSIKHWALTRV